jgi:molybdate transport system substrate-binding protein
VQGPETPAVHVAAAVSLEEVLGQLLADFALRRPADRVRAVFGASDELADQLLAGAPGDLLLTADPGQLDRLATAGLVEPGSPVLLAENTLAAIGPADRDPPVRRCADLASMVGARLALADPASPLGRYTRAFLDGLGACDALVRGAIVVDNSRAVLAAVRSGLADVGLVYGSDAAQAEGCRVLFRVRRPPLPIRYAAAILGHARHAEAARVLLDFLTSRPAALRFRRLGFLPAPSH